MIPAYAMVLLSQNTSTGNGHTPGCSFILSVRTPQARHWVHVVRTRGDVFACYVRCLEYYGERCTPKFEVNAGSFKAFIAGVGILVRLSPAELEV